MRQSGYNWLYILVIGESQNRNHMLSKHDFESDFQRDSESLFQCEFESFYLLILYTLSDFLARRYTTKKAFG